MLFVVSCLPVQVSRHSAGVGHPENDGGRSLRSSLAEMRAGHAGRSSIWASLGLGLPHADKSGEVLSCDTSRAVLQPGQSLTLNCGGGNFPAYSIGSPDAATGSDIGVLLPAPGGGVVYSAPLTLEKALTVKVAVEDAIGKDRFFVTIRVVPPSTATATEEGETRGTVGRVFRVPPGLSQIPDLGRLKPVQRLVSPNLDFHLGLPGVGDRDDWLGVRFDGQLAFPVDGVYQFQLAAVDGAIFYLDDTLVVNNDGRHPWQTVPGESYVSAGRHRFRVDYYQGPRDKRALQLLWKKPGEEAMAIIPPDAFFRH